MALCLMYFTQAYGFYFNITWLPTYLKKARGFSATALGLLAGLPLILSAVADLIGRPDDRSADARVRPEGGPVRRSAALSLLVAGLCLIAGAAAEHALLAALLIAVAGAADSFLLGAAWGTCLDIAGPHAGLVTGAMNTAGQIGAFLSPIILPLFLEEGAEDWATPLACDNCMAHCGFEGTAVNDAFSHPLKALTTAVRGPRTSGPMAPNPPILYQQRAHVTVATVPVSAVTRASPHGRGRSRVLS